MPLQRSRIELGKGGQPSARKKSPLATTLNMIGPICCQ
jgi:hypothetical protein